MQNSAPSISSARPWVWAALTVVGLVVAFFAALGVAISLVARVVSPDAGPGGLRLDLAGFLLTAGAFGAGAVLLAGRVAFGSWLETRPRHLVLPAAGAALAIGVELALHEWARQSIGYYDWSFIGWTAGLSVAILLVAVAWFGALVAPPGAAAPPRIGMGLSAILVVLIVASNLPGLADGIEPTSWPLAILVGLAGLYAIGAVIVSLRGWSPR